MYLRLKIKLNEKLSKSFCKGGVVILFVIGVIGVGPSYLSDIIKLPYQ